MLHDVNQVQLGDNNDDDGGDDASQDTVFFLLSLRDSVFQSLLVN